MKMNNEFQFENIALSGFADKKRNFAEPNIFNSIFKKGFVKSLKVLTDDIKFAKKRLVTPKTVYSGVVDILQYDDEVFSPRSIEGIDALVSFNVLPSELSDYCSILSSSNTLKRVVIGVNCSNSEYVGEGVTFSTECELLQKAGISYTILKYTDLRAMEEGKYPYRVVRDQLPIPSLDTLTSPSLQGSFPLSTEDLYRVISEVVDIEKTSNKVFGIGPGTSLDAEILIYMKSQGWPERVQVSMLMGDLMESIEQKFLEEQKRLQASSQLPVKKTDNGITLTVSKEGNKYAGFFTG